MSFNKKEDVYTYWELIGSSYKKFDQGELLNRYDPQDPNHKINTARNLGSGSVRHDVKGGVCRSLCLKFIELRFAGINDPQELSQKLEGSINDVMNTQALYMQHYTDSRGKRQRVFSGDEVNGTVATHYGGYRSRRAVKSRADLCSKVIEGKQNYIYSFGNQRIGHSVAFDSSEGLLFFDPNFGIFHMQDVKLKTFTDWFKLLWDFVFIDNRESYKSIFHNKVGRPARREIFEFGQSPLQNMVSNPLHVASGLQGTNVDL